MRRVMVRYRVKPERLEEHEALVRAVFDELGAKAPPGIRYAAYKHDDVRFVHFAFIAAETNPLPALEAFRAFTAKIAERCDEPPSTAELTEVGAYGL